MMERTLSQADHEEVMQPLTLVLEDFADAAAEAVAQYYQLQEVHGENLDPTSASGLNHVLLGYCGPEDPQSDCLGFNIQPAGIPLTNTNGEFGGTGNVNLQSYQVGDFDNHLRIPSGDRKVPNSYPDLQVHQVRDFGNHLPAGEVPSQILHGIDDTSRTQSQGSQLFQNQLQQDAHISPVDQQYHQHMFQQLVDQQQPLHSQHMLPHVPTRGTHNLDEEIHKRQAQNRNHYDVGPGDGTYLTSWEESVKCIDRFRQLQEQQLYQQGWQLPIHHQPVHDQSSMNNVLSGTSARGCDQITEFAPFGPHHENFPREKVDPNTLYTGTYPSGLSMSTTRTAGSTVPGYSGSYNPGAEANPFGYPLVDVSSSSHLLNGIAYLGPPNQPINFNSFSTGGSGPCSELLNQDSAHSSSARSSSLDIPLQSGYVSYQGNNIGGSEHVDASKDPLTAGRTAAVYFPRDMLLQSAKRVKTGVGKRIADLEPRPPNQFAMERQRREHLNEKYQTLRSLVPNPTKHDRASIVADGINRIQELKRELETLMAEKIDREKRKQNCRAPVGERGASLHGANAHLQGQTLQTVKKTSQRGTEVRIRIINNELEVTVIQKHTPRFFLRVIGAIEAIFKLQVLESNGARIRNYNVYRFTATVNNETNTLISFMAGKLLEAVDAVF